MSWVCESCYDTMSDDDDAFMLDDLTVCENCYMSQVDAAEYYYDIERGL